MRNLKIIFLIFISINLVFIFKIHANSFQWPSSGWIGYLYGNPTSYCSGNCHTGIDIWSNQSGEWNNGNQIGAGNPVYSVKEGTIVFRGDNPNTGDGYIIYHGPALYTAYWHIGNKQKASGSSVSKGEYIGNQTAFYPDSAGSAFNNPVHMHFAILNSGSDNIQNAINPTSYMGIQLKYGEIGVPGWLNTYVTAGSCNGSNQVQSNWNATGPLNCNPTGTFTIMPESHLQSSGGDITIKAN